MFAIEYVLLSATDMLLIHVNIDPNENPWGLLGMVAYKSCHFVSLKKTFPLKLRVFLKNIVLHNIMCETNWIVIKTKFYG